LGVVTSPSSDYDYGTGRWDERPVEILHRFISRLRQRYVAVAAGRAGEGTLAAAIPSLTLAEAVVRDLVPRRPADRPRQVAVLGPTQVGKSTVVNLLLGERAAEVSPLAGFTVHPQGFAVGVGDEEWLAPFFPDWQRCAVGELARDVVEQYSFTHLAPAGGAPPLPQGTVVWDTPDFDSLAAGRYRHGVLETVALADAVVLVVSKEKYSDLAVWEMVHLIEPLGRPLLVCLNKVGGGAEAAITASLRRRLAEHGPAGQVEVVTLPQQAGLDGLSEAAMPPAVGRLREAARALAEGAGGADRRVGAVRLLKRHWAEWMAPLVAEDHARGDWYRASTAAVVEALATYRRNYLDHPQRFDAFRRAVVELLYLLELPGMASTLGRVRRLLTWPARQLFAGWRGGRQGGEASEVQVLEEMAGQLLATLEREVARRCDPSVPAAPFWRALSGRLAAETDGLRAAISAAARRHHEAFTPEIRQAAGQLYAVLQQRSALLNTLRAARVTTDAAAIAIAVKTAGLGVSDLLVAPAMLSLTSSLTEGALGGYMATVARELKERQAAVMEEIVFRGVIRPAIERLTEDLVGEGLFAMGPPSYVDVERVFAEWARG
jgi:hypothetical protein